MKRSTLILLGTIFSVLTALSSAAMTAPIPSTQHSASHENAILALKPPDESAPQREAPAGTGARRFGAGRAIPEGAPPQPDHRQPQLRRRAHALASAQPREAIKRTRPVAGGRQSEASGQPVTPRLKHAARARVGARGQGIKNAPADQWRGGASTRKRALATHPKLRKFIVNRRAQRHDLGWRRDTARQNAPGDPGVGQRRAGALRGRAPIQINPKIDPGLKRRPGAREFQPGRAQPQAPQLVPQPQDRMQQQRPAATPENPRRGNRVRGATAR